MNMEKSCGAVVFTRKSGILQYVLIQQLEGFWGFPKGHMEEGETEEETALREIYEEVHLTVTLRDAFRATDMYALPGKEHVLKQVVFFCAEFYDQELVPQNEELLNATLAPYEEVLQLLSFDSSRRILREANDFLLSEPK